MTRKLPSFLAPFTRRAELRQWERGLELRLERRRCLRGDPRALRAEAARRGWETRRGHNPSIPCPGEFAPAGGATHGGNYGART